MPHRRQRTPNKPKRTSAHLDVASTDRGRAKQAREVVKWLRKQGCGDLAVKAACVAAEENPENRKLQEWGSALGMADDQIKAQPKGPRKAGKHLNAEEKTAVRKLSNFSSSYN